MAGAAFLDVHSTFACRSSCAEGNPIAAPWYDPKRPAILYVADGVIVVGLTVLTNELRHSHSPTARRLWWAPAALFTAASLVSWRRNVAFNQAHP